MTCNHHDSGRRCKLPADDTPYCTLHATPLAEPEVVPETAPSSEIECGVVREDDLLVPEPEEAEVTPDVTPSSEFGCGVTKDDGTPCEAAPQRGTTFCIFHDPNYQEQRRLNSATGGRAPRKHGPRAPRSIDSVGADTSTAAGIQAVITAVVNLELTGQINPVRSRNILRALSVAARNIHVNRVNSDEYSGWLCSLVETLDECVADAHENDAPPPKPPKLDPIHAARAARYAQLTSRTPASPGTYASAAAYLNKLAAQYLNESE